MNPLSSRRDFLQAAALAGVGFWVADTASAAQRTGPNEQLRFACIGVGGKGTSDTADDPDDSERRQQEQAEREQAEREARERQARAEKAYREAGLLK